MKDGLSALDAITDAILAYRNRRKTKALPHKPHTPKNQGAKARPKHRPS